LIVIAIDSAAPHGYYLFWGLRYRVHHMFGIVRPPMPHLETKQNLTAITEHPNSHLLTPQPS
jgi:hypothetical protein